MTYGFSPIFLLVLECVVGRSRVLRNKFVAFK